jgi:hypothetical protein
MKQDEASKLLAQRQVAIDFVEDCAAALWDEVIILAFLTG